MQADFAARSLARLFSFCAALSGAAANAQPLDVALDAAPLRSSRRGGPL
ncbi:hypothetical protein BTI_3748 [Burkholderia thailandensis MSMB121]|nr:hypothetical protein BTI_3748 [Burkholderia thailandensis MSMB121]